MSPDIKLEAYPCANLSNYSLCPQQDARPVTFYILTPMDIFSVVTVCTAYAALDFVRLGVRTISELGIWTDYRGRWGNITQLFLRRVEDTEVTVVLSSSRQ
jgi:hypothetical protein